MGVGVPNGVPNLQSAIAGAKTNQIERFFRLLKSYQNLNVQNGLALPIWTSKTQVMVKRKVGSQIGNLTPDH